MFIQSLVYGMSMAGYTDASAKAYAAVVLFLYTLAFQANHAPHARALRVGHRACVVVCPGAEREVMELARAKARVLRVSRRSVPRGASAVCLNALRLS